ncbi:MULTISPECIES: hypothetical protein [unclassified Streptomyces]|uniref:hypothetical protein n=1 Tax=unclassified Streptomyces TaxID=2593676 RepID=UPI0033A6A087
MSNETQSADTPDDTRAGDRLVRAGAIIFFVGAVATLVTVAPLFLGTHPFPSVAYAVCMLMGVGFVVAAAGLLRSIADQRRRARAVMAGQASAATPAA